MRNLAMRSIRTSILRVLSATALAIAVVGSTDPASAGTRMGGGGFHGGGFGHEDILAHAYAQCRGFHGGHGFANRGFDHRFGFRGQRFVFVGSPGWGGYYGSYCSPYWWAVNPWLC